MLKNGKVGGQISTVSHQLKTPLSAIKGYLEVLTTEELGSLNKEQKEYLQAALQNVEQMKNLVRDFLAISRIEEKRLDLKPKPSDLVKLTRKSIEEFETLARAKNCTILFEAEENIPQLNIDPLKIKQVINNLVSNAINYNKKKGVVKINIFRKGKEVVFCCKDKGIGISKKEKEEIFKKFHRSERAAKKEPSGTGLGLFISKAIIEKSEGKIWFKSTEGEGSKFCFSLPVKK